MSEETYIRMKCPNCGIIGRGRAFYLQRDKKCLSCGTIVRFVQIPWHESTGLSQVGAESSVAHPQRLGIKQAMEKGQEAYEGRAYSKAKTVKLLSIGAATMAALLLIGGHHFLRSREKLSPYRDTLQDMMYLASYSVASFQVYLAESRYEQLSGGPSRIQFRSDMDERMLEGLKNKKTLLDEEVAGEFQQWIAGDMTAGFKEVPLREANLIRTNAPYIINMIKDISYSRQQIRPPNKVPSTGFVSGRVARIGVNNNNEQVLLVGPLVSSTVYNILRLDENERAELVIKTHVLRSLQALYDCAAGVNVKHVGIVIGYLSKDFLSEEIANYEALGFVTAIEDCRQFLEHNISQEELLRRAEILIQDRELNIKRIELIF